MKKFLLSVVTALLAVTMLGTLAACNEEPAPQPKPHTAHTYSTAWSTDETNHWHAATCTAEDACATAKSEVGAHTFVKGKCSVCQYVDAAYAPQTLAIDDSGNATVNATGVGVEYAYTARLANTYVLTWTDENAKISAKGAAITSGYEFELASGEQIVFDMSTVNGAAASYDVNLAVKEVVNYIALDDNGNATVNANGAGIAYVFNTRMPNTYILTWTDANAVVMTDSGMGGEPIESGYEFTLGFGESITLIMSTNDWKEDTYEINLAVKQEEVVVETLTVGSQTVDANYDGITYIFTAETADTYTISWESTNAYVMIETESGSESIDSGYEFTLDAGASITIYMCTNDGDDSYEVTIAGNTSEGDDNVDTDTTPQNLILDNNGNAIVKATATGIEYTLVVFVPETYVLTWYDANACVMVKNGDTYVAINSGYEFVTKNRGESVVFYMATLDGTTANYEVNVSVKVNYIQPDFEGNAVVSANGGGIVYELIVRVPDTYVLTFSDANAYIMLGGSTDELSSGYEFTTTERGQVVKFVMSTQNWDEDSYTINISVKIPELSLGTQTVEANGGGVIYVFEGVGNYIISFTDDNAFVVIDGSSDALSSGYKFTLAEGESIKFAMSTIDWADDSYEITISKEVA